MYLRSRDCNHFPRDFGAHMNILFITKLKVNSCAQSMVIKVPPPKHILCWLLNLSRIIIIFQARRPISFWHPFLELYLTIYHSKCRSMKSNQISIANLIGEWMSRGEHNVCALVNHVRSGVNKIWAIYLNFLSNWHHVSI